MERKIITSIMALMMIASMYFLAKIAAVYTISYWEESGQDKKNVKQSDKKIVIDAGHGGSDPGKVGINGALEKDINLAIAKLLQEKLTKAGFEVIMTRENDHVLQEDDQANGNSGKAVDMHKRIEIINGSGAKALVSIHQNSFGSASVKGPQVFYYDSSVEGAQFAQLMQEQLNNGMGVEKPRQTKSNDNYYLLKRSGITAIIVECGFLSNEQEAELLCSQEYQEKLADNICEAICSYYNTEL